MKTSENAAVHEHKYASMLLSQNIVCAHLGVFL